MNVKVSKLKEYNMNLFLATLDTLYYTIVAVTVRCIRAYTNAQDNRETYALLEAVEVEEVDQVNKDVSKEDEGVEELATFKTIHKILKTPVQDSVVGFPKNTIMYAESVSVSLYKNQTIEFDTRVAVIPYGEMVMMIEPRGRFFKVIWNEIEGWVLRDDLVDRAVRVYPEFILGEEQSVDHPNTARVRTILDDIFGLQQSDFPLQSGEYVLYRLWKKGIKIAWNEERPRVPGLWHKILKGVQGVHVGVVPKAGSIMEYLLNGDVGHLAYVEAVFPDDTIAISEVHYPDSGIYSERQLQKEDWRGYKPVFITVM